MTKHLQTENTYKKSTHSAHIFYTFNLITNIKLNVISVQNVTSIYFHMTEIVLMFDTKDTNML